MELSFFSSICATPLSPLPSARDAVEPRGVRQTRPGNGAYLVYQIRQQKPMVRDELNLAFQTLQQEGPIVRVVESPSKFYEIFLVSMTI
ncbi:unnamed protein product [Protopolystoma xenopodis]|uniref:Uncharacterized protein n=1 Tax=Protopolystoma xenopodis TaxID=117903 RepID=A0A448XMQ7_9PLAT|nr:unnamed protein product [Protopolystoma xenopodis]